jgi:hypothetical protein
MSSVLVKRWYTMKHKRHISRVVCASVLLALASAMRAWLGFENTMLILMILVLVEVYAVAEALYMEDKKIEKEIEKEPVKAALLDYPSRMSFNVALRFAGSSGSSRCWV